jgi:multidrug efflux pump subunit AcrA (membrane-fusion protein)
MFRKYIIPLVALAGVAFAIFTVISGDKNPPSAPPVAEASQSPYQASVAGSGLVEASTENISIGTEIEGIVSKNFVEIGSNVKTGDPLFKIDDRFLLEELNIRRATVQLTETQVANAQYELELSESLLAKSITSIADRDRKRFAAQKAEAQRRAAIFAATKISRHH